MWKKQAWDIFVMWSWNVRFLSKITPRLRTDDAGFILMSDEIAKHGSWSFVNCWGVPNTMKSVSDGLRAKKLADIQDDIDWNAACNSVIADENELGVKQVRTWVSSAKRWWSREWADIKVLRGVVYKRKSIGPKTDPCGTSYFIAAEEDKRSDTLTR